MGSLIIRSDASVQTGTEHLMRRLALVAPKVLIFRFCFKANKQKQ